MNRRDVTTYAVAASWPAATRVQWEARRVVGYLCTGLIVRASILARVDEVIE